MTSGDVKGLSPQPARDVVRSLLAAPLRIHRYRDAHTRMLREALDRLDGCE